MGDNDSDYSDSAWSSSSDMSGSGESSDVTYRPNRRDIVRGDNSSDSHSHAGSSRIEEEELEFLRNATPLRDEKLWEIQNWTQTGFYTRDSGSRWIIQEIKSFLFAITWLSYTEKELIYM